MDQTQNNTNPLTDNEINSLSGEDLKKVLAERLKSHKDQMAKIDASINGLCEEVEEMKEPNKEADDAEDAESLNKIEEQLDTDLNNAILDFATEDKILEDIEEDDGSVQKK